MEVGEAGRGNGDAVVAGVRAPAAVVAAHGMGQQVPFETLDTLLAGFGEAARGPIARTVIVGGERLHRLEAVLTLPDGSSREVHFYEAYWAPITEGQVGIRDVIGFLWRSGLSGIRHGLKPFRRSIFNAVVEFPVPARTALQFAAALAAFTAAALLYAVLVRELAMRASLGSPLLWEAPAWLLALLGALWVRGVLVQYVGDVAVYVQPQVLDRFAEMRQRIKDTVQKTTRAVYCEPYEDVILVGHSLGSVVLYDVLNSLLVDQALGIAGAPEVAGRTRLLLTFGSPLDKTAFIFGTVGRRSLARDALAASLQPLVTNREVRPPWINLYSPWDLISGPLDYYDLPDRSNPHPAANVRDPGATTPLLAHVEYWRGSLLFATILDHLGGRPASAR